MKLVLDALLVWMFSGFDEDVFPAVQLQAAAADHHVEAEQGEGLRGGRSAAGVQEGKHPGRLSRLHLT